MIEFFPFSILHIPVPKPSLTSAPVEPSAWKPCPLPPDHPGESVVTPKREDMRGKVAKWLRTQVTLALNQLTCK